MNKTDVSVRVLAPNYFTHRSHDHEELNQMLENHFHNK